MTKEDEASRRLFEAHENLVALAGILTKGHPARDAAEKELKAAKAQFKLVEGQAMTKEDEAFQRLFDAYETLNLAADMYPKEHPQRVAAEECLKSAKAQFKLLRDTP
jgi:uncharacterized protein YdcH (DUF465 family)